VPHLLRHGTSVFKVISERPVILPSECRALGDGAITTYLGLTRPARAGLELTTYRLLSESTTTRLRQPVHSSDDVYTGYILVMMFTQGVTGLQL
jgi:hypothetical protein